MDNVSQNYNNTAFTQKNSLRSCSQEERKVEWTSFRKHKPKQIFCVNHIKLNAAICVKMV